MAQMMNDWLDRYPPEKGDLGKDREHSEARNGESPAKMRIEAVLDLHGYTVEKALAELEYFLKDSRRKGLRKVLIIHGKGMHSSDSKGILKNKTQAFLQNCRLAGRFGHPGRNEGGTGATWVLIKR